MTPNVRAEIPLFENARLNSNRSAAYHHQPLRPRICAGRIRDRKQISLGIVQAKSVRLGDGITFLSIISVVLRPTAELLREGDCFSVICPGR